MTVALDVTALGTILSIWAHPDDETYLSGATMAAAAAAGQRVVCVSMTAGERGTPDPERWPPPRLAARRRLEHDAAMAVLGVTEHEVFDLGDGCLADRDADGIPLVARLIDEVRPDTILTFGPDGMTFHPDHVAVSRWVTAAWAERGCGSRLLQAAMTVDHHARFADLYEELGVFMADERPEPVDSPAFHLVPVGADLDRKLTALAAMASQTAAFIAMVGEEPYGEVVAEECFVEAGGRSRPG